MQLEHLTVVLRPRRPWQAIDLGFRMASRWWRQLIILWLCISLPWFALCGLLLATREAIFVAPLLLWWFKPALERPLLYFISRAVFGEQPSVRDVLRNLGNIMRPQALSWLLWRRLSPTRSFDMPVTLLEGLNGRERNLRIGILHMNHATPASWLTLLGAHVEVFLTLAIMVLIETMLPPQVEWQWFSGMEDAASDYVVWYVLNYISMCIVAPFYVVCGFALYLNRRAQLEAWDIEVAFRRMREKYLGTSALTMALCCGVLAGWLLLPAPQASADALTQNTLAPDTAHTTALATPPATALESRQTITEVMQHKTFNERITYKVPKWFDQQQEGDTPDWVRWIIKWLKQWRDQDSDISKVSLLVARILEFLLWTTLAVGTALLAWRYREFLRQWIPSRAQRRPRVWRMRRLATREGIDLDVLPTLDDIGDNARTLWQQREQRAAMALLYVASLYELSASEIPLDDSHTELECVEIVQHYLDRDTQQYFINITNAWLRQAYAHKPPADAEFMAFCDQWRGFIRSIHASVTSSIDGMPILPSAAVAPNAGASHG